MTPLMSFAFARAEICGEGSEPMDRMQISGVLASDSPHVASRSKMQGSPYSLPNESTTKF
jgi:hypothetical protein